MIRVNSVTSCHGFPGIWSEGQQPSDKGYTWVSTCGQISILSGGIKIAMIICSQR